MRRHHHHHHHRPQQGGRGFSQDGRGTEPGFERGGRRHHDPAGHHFEDFESRGGGRGRRGNPDRRDGDRRGGPDRRGGRRGPHRAPRGDVRTAVLLLLAEEPMHGYQLMQTIAERTGDRWRPSPGAVYPTLSQLEDEGLVSSTPEGGRKLVSLTEAGRSHVEENSASWPDPFPPAAQDGEDQAIDLRELGHGLLGAVREVARTGTDEQVREVAQLLEEDRRRIYRILAGEK